MKKTLLIMLVFLIGVVAILSYYHFQYFVKLRKYNLTYPQKRIIVLEGKEYNVTVYKYNPPYRCPTRLLKNRTDVDYSMPEDTNLALWSAVGRNKEWYMSLHDEGALQHLLESDKRSGGRILEEYNKEKPLVPIGGSYEYLQYKTELKFNNENYVIFNMKSIVKGQELPDFSYRTFVKKHGIWLITEDIDKHPVKRLVGLNSYDEFIKLSKADTSRVPLKLFAFIIIILLIVIFFLRKK